jgi:hypothetical protein
VRLHPARTHVREPAVRRSQQTLPEVLASAGMTAGIDLCLALLAHDHGEALAREAARQLVVERRRPGGQSQFSPLLTDRCSCGCRLESGCCRTFRTCVCPRWPKPADRSRAT